MNANGVVWAVIMLLPGWAVAASSDPVRAETLIPGSGMLAQLTVGLAVVLAALLGLTWLLRRYALPQGGAIQVISALPLGSRERLLLIEVDRVRLLIGVTASQIQALHVFPASSDSSSAIPPFRVTADAPSADSAHDRCDS
ncbi:MAG: flagellar biosynthetic protein FliO [Synechococcaceae cyanobacterium SM1_2_3]|nr:flagellar biosynthetic protein FliO [Synechococcaceae cyanobacterium SM1_2_3]